MRANIGIVELSSPLLRDLLREACAPIGRVTTFTSLEEARAAFADHPPKILIAGGAPLDPELLELLSRAVSSHGVIALALADAHDLQRAQRAGAIEGFPRTPEGLRALSLRLRPLLAPSLRPPAEELKRWSAQPERTSVPGSVPPAAGGGRCTLIAIGSFAPNADATAYLLSRLPTSLPGIVLLQVSLRANASELAGAIADECSWRVHELEGEQRLQPGSIWVADGSAAVSVRVGAQGPVLVRAAAPLRGQSALDALFESVARSYGPAALGVLLSASGDEGARGLEALRKAGGYTLAQRETSSVHPQSMPPRAAELGAHEVLGLERLPQAITAYCSGGGAYRSLRPSRP